MLDVRQPRWIELELDITPGYHRWGKTYPSMEENEEKSPVCRLPQGTSLAVKIKPSKRRPARLTYAKRKVAMMHGTVSTGEHRYSLL
jgi:hypothetical protein